MNRAILISLLALALTIPHAEAAEFESHAELAKSAEMTSHAENAESAEPKPHAEFAESAE